MFLAKLFIIKCLILQSSTAKVFFSESGCDKIKVSYEVLHTGPGGQDGKIVFRFEDNRNDYHIYRITNRDKELLPAARSEFNQLGQGKYTIVITGKDEKKNYCPEFFEIEVK